MRFNSAVLLYALVASDTSFAVDVFVERASADAALRAVLDDEPAFVDLLAIVDLPPSQADAFRPPASLN